MYVVPVVLTAGTRPRTCAADCLFFSVFFYFIGWWLNIKVGLLLLVGWLLSIKVRWMGLCGDVLLLRWGSFYVLAFVVTLGSSWLIFKR